MIYRSVADDIYMGYPDAQKIGTPGDDEVWILPCTEEVRVVFRLSKDSDEIPIHPLDATMYAFLPCTFKVLTLFLQRSEPVGDQ